MKRLSELDVDVAAFQEVEFEEDGTSTTLNTIRRKTPLAYTATHVLSESSFFPGRYAGVALASRYPLRNVDRHLLPNPGLTADLEGSAIDSFDKGFVSALATLPHEEVRVASLHSFPFHIFGRVADDTAFSVVWRDLAKKLHTLEGKPMLLAGDFNTPQRSLILHEVSAELNSAIGRRPTYRGEPIDDILYSPEFQVRSSRVLRNFSDHSLCVVDLQLRGKEIP